jgi:hypothetical protein
VRLPRPAPWQFLSGLFLLDYAFLLYVGSGMSIDVQHDEARKWTLLVVIIMVPTGLALLWLSLRDAR